MQQIKRNRLRFAPYVIYAAGLVGTFSSAGTAVAQPVFSKPIQSDSRGITIPLAQGWLRLQVCTPQVIRVSYSPTATFPQQKVPTVIGEFAPVKFKVTSNQQSIKVVTSQLQAEVNRATGAVRFLTAQGVPIVGEASGARSLTATTLAGPKPVASFMARQEFALAPDENIYGLGQHQDRQGGPGAFTNLDYRGKTVSLQQDYITNIAIPFLVSSRGYGVLWNNPAPTTVKVGVGEEAPIPAAQFLNEAGEAGGLTAQYFNGTNFDTPVAKRTDANIDFSWTNPPVEGLAHDRYSVRWTGFIQTPRDDDYTLMTQSDDGVRLWLDDKLVVDNWNVHPLANNEVMVHWAANSRHKIRLEYYQDQYDAVIKLAWRTKPQNPVVSWVSEAADGIDYYFFYGPSLDAVMAGYRQATGQVPMPPKWALGFWQSKERYNSQQELLDVAAEYRSRRIPLDNIVQDWYYWNPAPWGSHYFDPKRYPNMAAAVKELHDKQHVQTMISVWGRFNPGTPDNPNANYNALNAKGYLYPKMGDDRFYDAFNPAARDMYWGQVRDQILSKGVDAWWLDASEPEVDLKQFRSVLTGAGLGVQVMNAWPLMHTTGVYQGQLAVTPNKRPFILTRSAYAGQQRNGTTIWSSDITASWQTLAHQVPIGLNMGLSGFPYWATDTGGFFVPYPNGSENPEYRELFTRWFEWSALTPVFRVHGTNTPRELWRFGPEHEAILVKYDNLRYHLMPYIYSQAWQISNNAGTLMRPLVMDFPQDKTARELSDEYLFGPSLLVCPVTAQGATSRSVYLPQGAQWTDFWTGQQIKGGQTITAPAPLGTIPVFVKAGSIVPMGPTLQYVAEKPADPIELRVYAGADGAFTLYEDEGTNTNYERGQYATIWLSWNDKSRTLTIGARKGSFPGMLQRRTFNITLVKPGVGVGTDEAKNSIPLIYTGKQVRVKLSGSQ